MRSSMLRSDTEVGVWSSTVAWTLAEARAGGCSVTATKGASPGGGTRCGWAMRMRAGPCSTSEGGVAEGRVRLDQCVAR